MDCSTQQLALDNDGAFNHTVNSEKIKNGELPYKLIARGRDGRILAEEVVTIGLTYHAKRAGLKVPQPKQSCR